MTEPLLRVKNLTKNFEVGGGFLAREKPCRLRRRQHQLRHSAGRDARARRRIRLGKIDDRPLHPAPSSSRAAAKCGSKAAA